MIVMEFKKFGANSYVLKNVEYDILLKTIAEVHTVGYSFNDIFKEV
jgi:DNA-binding NarL/FixJ family response regulator